MPRELVSASALYGGAPYSYAAIAPATGNVFTAGACPLDADGRVVGPGDVVAQTRQVLKNLLVALDSAGCRPHDVVKTTVYVATTDRSELATVWGVVEEVFGADGPPSTLLGVACLGWPEQLVEIEAVAARSD
jgi:enamine deaminase RidA (YjgF/YER057c/UK114 family)